MGLLDELAKLDPTVNRYGKEDALGKEAMIKSTDVWNYDIPELQDIDLETLKYIGNYNPELLKGTSLEKIAIDPSLKAAQMDALSSLQDIASQGGMTLQDKANLERMKMQVAEADKGRRDAIMQNMATRGMGGSGMELLANLQSSQAATNQAAQQGLDIAGMAQQRALDAMSRGGDLAGRLRGQDYEEQANLARAKDAINQFNTQYMNQAQQQNLANQQNINNQNAAIKNQQTMQNQYTKPLAQHDMKTQQIAGQSAANQGMQGYWSDVASRKSQKDAGILGGLGTLGAAGIMAFSDEDAKKEIEPVDDFDIKEFLKAVKPVKYEYKEKLSGRTPEGEQIGLILQDVEGTKLGDELINDEETDGMMTMDPNKLNGIMLAALSHLAKKGKM